MKMKIMPYNKALDTMAIALKLQADGQHIRAQAAFSMAAKEDDLHQALSVIHENNQFAFTAAKQRMTASLDKPETAAELLANIKAKRGIKADTTHDEEPAMTDESGLGLTNASDATDVAASEEGLISTEENLGSNTMEAIDDMIAEELDVLVNGEGETTEATEDEELPTMEELQSMMAKVLRAAKKKK